MSKLVQGILVFVLIVAAAVIGWAVMSVTKPPAQPAEEAAAELSPGQSMSYSDNMIREERGGRTVWELTAEEMRMDVGTRDAEMKKITGKYYYPDGRTVSFTADTGQYEAATKNIVLRDGVKVEVSDGAHLVCRELHLDGEERKLSAIGEAAIAREGMRGSGDRIESTDGFRIFRITGDAHLSSGAE